MRITESQTAIDGRNQQSVSFKSTRVVNLYCVKFRKTEVCGDAQITLKEAACGARIGDFTGDLRKVFDCHGAGLMRDVSAEAVLTWDLSPRDEIIRVIPINLSGVTTVTEVEGQPGNARQSFEVERVEYQVRSSLDSKTWSALGDEDNCFYEFRCWSNPGRGASLGEDDLDGAYGIDAIRSAVEAYLTGDERPSLCSVECIPVDTLDSVSFATRAKC